MVRVPPLLQAFVRRQDGATAIEYALIAALISLAIISGVVASGTSVGEGWDAFSDRAVAELN